MIEPEAILILPRIRVQNANAISSPMTWGFPSPSAFTGFAHALHRQLQSEFDLCFEGVGIICHEFEPQASKPPGKHHHVFHLTRNPLGKDEKAASIVEEGRAHLTVSLVIGVSGSFLYSGTDLSDVAMRVYRTAAGTRLAGGSILERTSPLENKEKPALHIWPGGDDDRSKLNKRLARQLLPGFALVSREAMLDRHWQVMREANPSATMLDALLDLAALSIQPSGVGSTSGSDEPSQGANHAPTHKVEWAVRRSNGWIVPIPAGYGALSEIYAPGTVKNVRDRTVPFRFVEGLYTVGEWLSPHRVDDVRHLLWFHEADPNTGVYRWTTPHFAGVIDEEGN